VEDVIIPAALSLEEANAKFPKGIREVNSYLRYTPQPEL
jgi:hypothetical protein